MVSTALPRTVHPTRILEPAQRDRRVSGEEWQRVAVLGTTDADVGNHVAINFSAYADPGIVGEVRLRTEDNQVSQSALVNGQLDNAMVGFIVLTSAPTYVFLEARGQAGNAGGVHVFDANLLDLEGVPAALLTGPTYPPGYSPNALGADMAITSVPNVQVLQGNQASVVVNWANNGPQDGGNFDVRVEIPTDATFNAGASSPNCVIVGPDVVCSMSGPIADGATGSVSVAFDVAGAAATGTQTLDVEIVNQQQADPNNVNDTTTTQFTITQPIVADLAVSLPVSTQVEQGAQLTLVGTVNNLGPDSSGTYDYSVQIPTDATFNAGASTAGGSVNGGNVEWIGLAGIPAAGNATVNAVFDMAGGAGLGTQNVTATISNQAESDPSAANDSDSGQVEIVAPGSTVFPSVISVSTQGETPSSTTHDTALSTTPAAGDLILVASMLRHDGIVTGNNGLVVLSDNRPIGTRSLTLLGKIAAGGESTFELTSTISSNWSSLGIVIEDFHGSLAEGVGWSQGVATDGGGAFIDPASVTAAWGSARNLFLTFIGLENDDATIASYPANWTHAQAFAVSGGGLNSGCTIAVAARQLEVASADPGAFNASESEGYVARTFAFRPA